MKLSHTRAIIDAIHSGELSKSDMIQDEIFGVAVPTQCSGVPAAILDPRNTWDDPAAYDLASKKLAVLFRQNFRQYEEGATDAVLSGGPRI